MTMTQQAAAYSTVILVSTSTCILRVVYHSMHTSYYAHYFHGRTTANGETFNMWANTAAHKTLPFGTRLRVCYSGCVDVRINDRGPFIAGRHLDLSYGAASRIGLLGPGVAWTDVTYL